VVEDSRHTTLDIISFGLAVGVTLGLITFLLGLTAGLLEWGVPVVAVLSSIFIGYSPTLVGSFAGVVWAFFDGFVTGLLISWLYNRFLLRRRRHASQ
jgi:hypothetical protein